MNMNCNEYREAITADPSESFDGARRHVEQCDDCRAYRAEIRALDARIAAALAIDVPKLEIPELPPVDAESNVVGFPKVRTKRISTPAWIGIAASFAIAAVLGIRFMAPAPQFDSLADQVLAHLDHEPNALNAVEPVSERRLDRVVRSNVASLDEQIGLITYARTCVINGRKIPHLVIQGESGPVTLLLLPEEHVESAVTFEGDSVNGVILPVGDGSIAIIGERDENMSKIEKRVIDSVEWSI